MFVPQSWLIEALDQSNPGWSASTQELDDAFVKVGFEIEGVPQHLSEVSGPLRIGRVLEFEELEGFKKPIRFCQVDVNNDDGQPQQIICGARNFAEGDLVVAALPGAVLPGGFEISSRKTYGKLSEGMMCSLAELGVGNAHDGIIVLPDGTAQPGDPAQEVLGLDDTIFEVNITPDRGYALSVRGLTRELAAGLELRYTDPAVELALGTDRPAYPVTVDPATNTTRFAMRRLTDVDLSKPTPWWIQRRLILSGVRPINAAVDVGNYVMLELGQPMHAFDQKKLSGELTVRRAAKQEKILTLDGVERTLSVEDVVVADENGVLSIAGIMGGASTQVDESTTEILFEAACFESLSIFRTGRRQKLSSESSRRFERSVDPALAVAALDRAASLLASITGATIAPELTDIGTVPAMKPILFGSAQPSTVAGFDYPEGTTQRRLNEVGCTIVIADNPQDSAVDASELAAVAGTALLVTPPTWRPDLQQSADLVEEVVRLEGLEKIPSIPPLARIGRGYSPEQRRRMAISRALASNGYAEVIPTPFMADDALDRMGLPDDDPRRIVTRVLNPLESSSGTLATTLLPALFDVAKRNISRGQHDLSLYGVAQVCLPKNDAPQTISLPVDHRPSDDELRRLQASLPSQPLHVAVVLTGLRLPTGTWGKGRSADAWDAIEAARVVARAAFVDVTFANDDHAPFHPGRCAAIFADGKLIGYAGELHPAVIERCGLPARTCAMEISVDALPHTVVLPSPKIFSYPPVMQDVALVVDELTPSSEVERALRRGAGDLLEDVSLFDVFRGEQIGNGKKSLAFKLRFRAPDRTLTEDEASESRNMAVDAAHEAVDAVIRA